MARRVIFGQSASTMPYMLTRVVTNGPRGAAVPGYPLGQTHGTVLQANATTLRIFEVTFIGISPRHI